MRDGIHEAALSHVPAGRDAVQPAHPLRVVRAEPGAQGIGEEVVVAPPPALVVEGDDEEVGPFERLQHLLPVVSAGQRVTEAAGELVEHAGVEEEGPDAVGLGVEDLLEEVVEDEAVAAGELLDEPLDAAGPGRGAPACRERGELEPGGPALGARLQGGDLRLGEIEPHDVVEEPARLVPGEAQVGGAHLDELAAGPQPREGQRRVGTGRHREGHLGRQVVDEEGHGLVHGGGVDHVVVVEADHRVAGQRVEVVEQADEGVVGAEPGVGLQEPERLGTGLRPGRWGGAADGRDEVGEEPVRVGVAGVEREPRDPQRQRRPGPRTVRCAPAVQRLGEHRRLPEPCGGGDEDEPGTGPDCPGEALGEAGSGHEPGPRPRHVHLGAQNRHGVSVRPARQPTRGSAWGPAVTAPARGLWTARPPPPPPEPVGGTRCDRGP